MSTRKTTLAEFPLPDTSLLETQLITDIVMNPALIGCITGKIKPEQFVLPHLADAYRCLINMQNSGDEISMPTITAKFGANLMQQIYGRMGEAAQGINDFETHIRAYQEARLKFAAYDVAFRILQEINNPLSTAQDLLRYPETMRLAFNDELPELNTACSIGQCLHDLGQEIATAQADEYKGKSRYISTGIETIDRTFAGGFNPGNLVILAARPGVGKSALALEFALNAAESGRPVLFFSYELKKIEIAERVQMRTGKYRNTRELWQHKDWNYFNTQVDRFADIPLYVNDVAPTFEELCQMMLAFHNSGRADMVVIDYLGLIPEIKKATQYKTATIGAITGALKRFAMKNGIPVLVLAQLNREIENREGGIPQLSDLRDSGDIEQDADRVLMLSNPQGDPLSDNEVTLDLWVRKNRTGANNIRIPLAITNKYSKFEANGEPTH